MSILSFTYAGYSRNVSCALDLIYTIVLLNITEYTYKIMEAQKTKRIPLLLSHVCSQALTIGRIIPSGTNSPPSEKQAFLYLSLYLYIFNKYTICKIEI
jgi:hypothetical protein